MKKLVLGLLLLANSLFAVTISQIMNADPAYKRAHIVQVEIRDSKETQSPVPAFLTKLNIVDYPYLGDGYPYTNIEYSGKIRDWWYTQYYDVYRRYESWFDSFIDPNDLSRTYIIINLENYGTNQVSLRKYVYGQGYVSVPSTTFNGQTYPYYSNGYKIYLDTGSSSISSYEVKTHIQASDGTVDLYSNVSLSRDVQ
jgi:hypothetical protein